MFYECPHSTNIYLLRTKIYFIGSLIYTATANEDILYRQTKYIFVFNVVELAKGYSLIVLLQQPWFYTKAAFICNSNLTETKPEMGLSAKDLSLSVTSLAERWDIPLPYACNIKVSSPKHAVAPNFLRTAPLEKAGRINCSYENYMIEPSIKRIKLLQCFIQQKRSAPDGWLPVRLLQPD